MRQVVYDGQEYNLVEARCCRVWELILGYDAGTCGYCGQTPEVIDDIEYMAHTGRQRVSKDIAHEEGGF